jgi:hypothetical protein
MSYSNEKDSLPAIGRLVHFSEISDHLGMIEERERERERLTAK